MLARVFPFSRFTLCTLLACAASAETGSPDAGNASGVPSPDDGGQPAVEGTGDAQTAAEGGPSYAFPCLGLGEREPTGELGFDAIYVDIFCKIGCTDGYCHGPRGGWGGLSMTSIDGAYTQLVGQPTGQLTPVDDRETCRDSDLLRVAPGDPEASLLYLKVTGDAPCGTPMPPPNSGRKALSMDERDQIRDWIAAGAPLTAEP